VSLRFLSVTWCDDIRQEAFGKTSLIGVYGPNLIVKELPTTLAKLCARVKIITSSKKPFKRLILRLCMDDKVLMETQDFGAAQEDKPTSVPHGKFPGDAEPLHVSIIHLEMSPLQLSQECRLRIRVETEAEELRDEALTVVANPEAKIWGEQASHGAGARP
jgi:hypothetical protein